MEEAQGPYDPKNHVASVEKAVRLLELFNDQSPRLTLTELVRQGGYSRTTTYRLLATLERVGWIVRDGDRYQLSLRLFRLGSTAVGALQLRHEATHAMSELAARCGEAVYLIVPDGPRGVCLERIEGNSPVQIMSLDVGRSMPLYVGGGTLALLAERDDLLRTVLSQEPLETPTGRTLTREELMETLEAARRSGYSRSVEDVTMGVGAFGAVVRDASGFPVAAVSVGGLVQTLQRKEAELSSALIKTARTISERLGHSGARSRVSAAPRA